jgi:hypothetical protein
MSVHVTGEVADATRITPTSSSPALQLSPTHGHGNLTHPPSTQTVGCRQFHEVSKEVSAEEPTHSPEQFWTNVSYKYLLKLTGY